MIPYFSATTFYLGPIPIHVWGLFVATGMFVGAYLNVWLAKQRKQDPNVHWDLAFWVIIGAMIGGRLFDVVFYDPAYYLANPLQIPAIWNGGMSIIGGFIGAVVAAVLFLKKKKVDVFAYIDTGVFGLPIGIAIGRLGCFLIHDHPGTATSFFLGVKYPDGIVRHDLGLDESLVGLAITIAFLVLWKRKATTGTYLWVFCLLYGTARFFLDFLRATSGPIVDPRYFGLTPAQYAAAAMILIGAVIWRHCRLSIDKKP